MSRRKHEPTPVTKGEVTALSGFGIAHEQIAKYIGIDAKTLRKHYRDELDNGMTKANIAVARSLFEQATKYKNTPASIFWLKARAGWRDRTDVRISGDPNNPLQIEKIERVIIRGGATDKNA